MVVKEVVGGVYVCRYVYRMCVYMSDYHGLSIFTLPIYNARPTVYGVYISASTSMVVLGV